MIPQCVWALYYRLRILTDISMLQVMVAVLFVTRTSGPAPWFGFATNVITVRTRAVVQFAGVPACRTLTTARSAQSRRRTGMVAPRSLIWVAQKLICFMREKSMASRKDDHVAMYLQNFMSSMTRAYILFYNLIMTFSI